MEAVNRFWGDSEGGVLVEYALLSALIALAAVAGMTAIRDGLTQKFLQIAATMP